MNLKRIQKALFNIVGFRPSFNVNDSSVDSDLVESTSGLIVNDEHPLLTIQNLESIIQDNPVYTEVVAWDSSTPYKEDTLVAHGNAFYYALQDNENVTPGTDADTWKNTNIFSYYLRCIKKSAISKLITTLTTNSKIKNIGRDLLQNTLMFYDASRVDEKPYNRFVGFRFWLSERDTKLTFNKVAIQLKLAQTITLYLYHSESNTALKSFEINYTNAGRVQWFDLTDAIIFFNNEILGGSYEFGYFESDLITNNCALCSTNFDFTGNTHCASCDSKNIFAFRKWSNFVNIVPIEVGLNQITNKPSRTWYEDDIIELATQNWGLNFVFSVNCDITDIYVNNAELFATALASQLKHDLLTAIAYNQRHNGLSDAIQSYANAALQSAKDNPIDLLNVAVASLELDLSGLNPVCLPCKDKNTSVQIRSVW